SLMLDVTAFGCAEVGMNTVTLTVTDENSNVSMCTATVTVEDNIAPTITCVPAGTVVPLDPDGMHTFTIGEVLDLSNTFDNCSYSLVSIDPAVVDCDDVGGPTMVRVIIADPSGNRNMCTAEIEVSDITALPSPWVGNDVGGQGTGSEYSFNPCTYPDPADGTFTIGTGAVNNIATRNIDNLAFISQELCGDASITVKVESVTGGWGGVMMRESLDQDAKFVSITTRSPFNIAKSEWRTTTGGFKMGQNHGGFNYWLRIVRTGNLIRTYTSFNGVSFYLKSSRMIPMSSCIEVGMAAFADQPGTPVAASFSNVDVIGQVGSSPVFLGGTSGVEVQGADAAFDASSTDITLYPNPARSNLTVEFSQASEQERTLLLRNQLGQVVNRQAIDGAIQQLDMDLSGLRSGTYLLEVREAGEAPRLLRFMKVD
ncbi:T9SS type A sorting domain-containing protein, partial [Phaeodactylibacter luteus]